MAYRAEAIPVLVQALANGKGDVETRYIQSAKQQILKGIHDRDAVVRGETVIAPGAYGGADMIPALKEVARSDPGSDTRTDNLMEWFPIREEAAKAIAEIETRTAGNVPAF
ncbi:MAG: HEAT repeat domain-containing protein [Candidatus Sulfotelmatobacter sp.]